MTCEIQPFTNNGQMIRVHHLFTNPTKIAEFLKKPDDQSQHKLEIKLRDGLQDINNKMSMWELTDEMHMAM